MAEKLNLKKIAKNIPFSPALLRFFGTKAKVGDQHIFDRRGAIVITDKEMTNKKGDIVSIRGIADAGPGSSMVINRPGNGVRIDAQRAMDAYHGWPYAATRAIAEEIANIEWKVFKIDDEGSHIEDPDHEIIDFLDSVNDFQTGPEFKNMMVSHLELAGNAFILLEGVQSADDKPKSMFLLDPSRVQVILDKSIYPYKIARYDFVIDGRTIRYQPYEIIQLKYPNPSNPYLGLGTTGGIAEWIDNDNNTTEFLRQFFNNGAQIGLTFETDMSSEEQLQALRDAFNEQHSGVHNAYKGLFLPKGVKKPTGGGEIQIKDLGISDISNTSRDKILAGFRVSKTILGTAESDTNRATAETADYVFAKRTIKPKMILICSYLNEFLTPRFADDVFISFYDPVPDDKSALQSELEAAIANMPVLTVNEAREKYLGLEPVEGGDELLAQNNFVKAATLTMENEPPKPSEAEPSAGDEGEPAREESKGKKLGKKLGYTPRRLGKKGKTQFAKSREVKKKLSEEIAVKIAKIFEETKKKSFKDMTDEEYRNIVLVEKDTRMNNYQKKFVETLRKLNAEQEKEVLDNLHLVVKAIDVSKLFNLSKWINLTINATKPIAKDLFGKEASAALHLIDAPGWDVENDPNVASAIENAMTLMSESYQKSTVDLLQEKISEGMASGMSIDQISELVSQIYEWKDTVAADRVAQTEVNRITNDAGKMAWEQSGEVKQLEWITAPTGVCPFCDAMEGKIIDIQDNFFDKGDDFTVDGSTLDMDYSDVGGPPLHPNCRCHIKPVLDTSFRAADILGPGKKEEEKPPINVDAVIKELDTL